jgi:hypothetical protein
MTKARLRRGKSRFVAALLFAATSVASGVSTPSAASADARRDYLDGLRALRDGRLAPAIEAFERAAAERPQEEARVRLVGAIPQPYLPWHHLAAATAQAGRCDRARQARAESDRQAVAATVAEAIREIARTRELCPPTAVPAPVTTPVPAPAASAGSAPAAPVPEVSSAAWDDVLELGARHFAEGDYRAALHVLEPLRAAASERASRRQALADLFAAASAYALYQLDGASDAELERQALAAASRARRVAPDVAPGLTVFSPRFIDWYAGTSAD